jgi:hypothetical protein
MLRRFSIMRFKMIVMAVSIILFIAAPVFSADITGTWVTEVPAPKGGPGGGFGGGQRGPSKMTLVFNTDGSKLGGTFTGLWGNTNDIVNGKIDGNKLTFDVKVNARGSEFTLKFQGTVSGDEFKYTYTTEGGMSGPGRGNRPPTEYTAKRQK